HGAAVAAVVTVVAVAAAVGRVPAEQSLDVRRAALVLVEVQLQTGDGRRQIDALAQQLAEREVAAQAGEHEERMALVEALGVADLDTAEFDAGEPAEADLVDAARGAQLFGQRAADPG